MHHRFALNSGAMPTPIVCMVSGGDSRITTSRAQAPCRLPRKVKSLHSVVGASHAHARAWAWHPIPWPCITAFLGNPASGESAFSLESRAERW